MMHIKAQFERYVAQYKGLVITVCLAMTKNYFDAEDLAQETFLSAYRNGAGLTGNIRRRGLRLLPSINAGII